MSSKQTWNLEEYEDGPTTRGTATDDDDIIHHPTTRKRYMSLEIPRPTWSNKMDFVFSLIGYAVGVGNIWRFPYLCYRNGGGAFLIPYTIMLFLCGIPLFFLEVALGQFSNRGAIKIWDVCPLFRGVGIGTLVITCIGSIYYNLLIAFILFFLFSSFRQTLPWSHCDNSWNTASCIVLRNLQGKSNNTFYNQTSVPIEIQNQHTSTFEYWHYGILNLSDGLHNFGSLNWKLGGCFLIAWTLTYLCLIRGIKSTGKIVYFTATFPYFMLTILLIRSLFLPGASEGIQYFIRPKWSSLKDFKVWNEAATQIFYSLGPGWSGLITMASYNNFRNNCLRDSFIVSIVNCGTSFYAGLLVFSVLGFMSHTLNLPLEKVATEGVGLAFIVYPESLLYLPFSPLWSILFFSMLFTVGIDTIFVSLEVLYSALFDQLPAKYRKNQWTINLGTSIILMILGIPLLFEGGLYLFQLIDWYVALLSVMTFCLFETVAISWIYGIDKFVGNIQSMLNRRLRFVVVWKILWKYVNPIMLSMMLVSNIVFHVPVKYGTYEYPKWAINFGWCISIISLVPIPIYAVYCLWNSPGDNLLQRVKISLKPLPNWGPITEPYQSMYSGTSQPQQHLKLLSNGQHSVQEHT